MMGGAELAPKLQEPKILAIFNTYFRRYWWDLSYLNAYTFYFHNTDDLHQVTVGFLFKNDPKQYHLIFTEVIRLCNAWNTI